ncbi:MAG: DUF3343 domain-containing protein [Fibrobacter sp.]|jgi:hypothetical protein|nr:DUF3343 domain-containing protein [Fibrobacter sp.]
MRLLALFRSTREVIGAEKLCRAEGISCKSIPVPREISSECGIALEFSPEDKEKATALFNKESVSFSFYEV